MRNKCRIYYSTTRTTRVSGIIRNFRNEVPAGPARASISIWAMACCSWKKTCGLVGAGLRFWRLPGAEEGGRGGPAAR